VFVTVTRWNPQEISSWTATAGIRVNQWWIHAYVPYIPATQPFLRIRGWCDCRLWLVRAPPPPPSPYSGATPAHRMLSFDRTFETPTPPRSTSTSGSASPSPSLPTDPPGSDLSDGVADSLPTESRHTRYLDGVALGACTSLVHAQLAGLVSHQIKSALSRRRRVSISAGGEGAGAGEWRRREEGGRKEGGGGGRGGRKEV